MFIEVKDLDEVFHIPEPWYIDRCVFDHKLKQLDVKYREEISQKQCERLQKLQIDGFNSL